MSSSSTGHPPQMGSTAVQLAARAFTATRPGLTTQVPPGHESLMWVANSATLIYGRRDAALVDTLLTIDQGVELADRIAAGGKNLTRRLFPGEIPDEPGIAETAATGGAS